MDTAMSHVITKIQHGDPIRGWEGDPRLCVYYNGDTDRFELWRLEDDNEYRIVCRSTPGTPFDERVIDALVGWDRHRAKVPLHEQVMARNAELDAAKDAHHSEWIAEEIAPRLRKGIRNEAGW
jgi:hypothetical protein